MFLQVGDDPFPEPGAAGQLWLLLTAGVAGMGTWVCSRYRRAEKQADNT